ncbi:DNA-binding NtrC family response regulator [Desulfosalsimonas propionicica]|uniref:DNA-binding NtrC family response regulator n=1 Tax=Desulfosalsimonas propionicica TaxID=332175 RepID=A0A7W0CC00_9BACT|nr:sigma-54 dependent transcriptional regulator [Desulfosalsimonas propionicica]MBA2882931.1 DNA-binding NtrC family response regulator [Desulfosalsimonas propionicica]
MTASRVLIVDDDQVARKNLVRIFSRQGYDVLQAGSGTEAVRQVSEGGIDLVITDLVMDEMNGLELLSRIRDTDPAIEVIVVTAYASIATAIEATKKGAYHYLEKPFRPEAVTHLAQQAIEKSRLRKKVSELETRLQSHRREPALIGESPEIREVVNVSRQVAKTDCNVLITGESGTGKELAAQTIHYHSGRRDKNFLAVNCGAFTEDLLANELFGHEKDAFTGASTARAGLLETASGGTLFLDEIGDMPLSMQVKVMRALEEQKVIRVGGNQPVPVDVRIIAATNKDLKKALSAGFFRQDLYFRLKVISIYIPPLRERKRDIPLLAHFFLTRAANKTDKKFTGFSKQAMDALLNYDFPGNVRELENIVERAAAMARDQEIQTEDLPPDISEMEVFSFSRPDAGIKSLEEIKQDYIQWVLNKSGRNKTRAAQLLGINRASLWRHLRRNEIED